MWDVQHFWKSPEITARAVFRDKGLSTLHVLLLLLFFHFLKIIHKDIK